MTGRVGFLRTTTTLNYWRENEMAELKTCPFCGGTATIVDDHQWIDGRSNGGRYKYIHCVRCNCRTASFFWDEKKELVKTWNRRAGEDG